MTSQPVHPTVADRAAIVTDVVEHLTGRPPATFQDWCRRNVARFA